MKTSKWALLIIICTTLSISAQVSDNVLNEIKRPLTIDKIKIYASQVKLLVANPKAIALLSANDALMLHSRIMGAYFRDKMSKSDWDELSSNEVKLTGLLLMSLESRIDPTIDITKEYSASYPPYEAIAQEEGGVDEARRKKYNETIRIKMEEHKRFQEQCRLRQNIAICVIDAQRYLGNAYADRNDVIAILKKANIDQKIIDLLTGPPGKLL